MELIFFFRLKFPNSNYFQSTKEAIFEIFFGNNFPVMSIHKSTLPGIYIQRIVKLGTIQKFPYNHNMEHSMVYSLQLDFFKNVFKATISNKKLQKCEQFYKKRKFLICITTYFINGNFGTFGTLPSNFGTLPSKNKIMDLNFCLIKTLNRNQ